MQLKGALVRDVARAPVGEVVRVLLGPDDLTARWLQVRVDPATTVLVPAASATEFAPGELLVPYARATITAAVHVGDDALTAADGERLMVHYGFTAQEFEQT